MLTREQNVRAIIETHFAGFKEEIIDSAVNRILELKDEPNQRTDDAFRFCKWVGEEIFDEDWEDNQDSFAEIACRKLAKIGIVKLIDGNWELVESEESLEQEPVLDKIRAEIEALPKTYPIINHIFDTYVKEDDVRKIIDKYKAESEEEK